MTSCSWSYSLWVKASLDGVSERVLEFMWLWGHVRKKKKLRATEIEKPHYICFHIFNIGLASCHRPATNQPPDAASFPRQLPAPPPIFLRGNPKRVACLSARTSSSWHVWSFTSLAAWPMCLRERGLAADLLCGLRFRRRFTSQAGQTVRTRNNKLIFWHPRPNGNNTTNFRAFSVSLSATTLDDWRMFQGVYVLIWQYIVCT